MSEKSKAEVLADALEEGNFLLSRDRNATAAELRRLVAEHEEDQRVIAVWRGRTQRAEAQRDALLEALQWIDKRCPRSIMKHPPHLIHQEMAHDAGVRARAAIKAVEEGK